MNFEVNNLGPPSNSTTISSTYVRTITMGWDQLSRLVDLTHLLHTQSFKKENIIHVYVQISVSDIIWRSTSAQLRVIARRGDLLLLPAPKDTATQVICW